jgi:excisionase family DNA binding protein
MTVRLLPSAWRFSHNELSGKPGAVHCERTACPVWAVAGCAATTSPPSCDGCPAVAERVSVMLIAGSEGPSEHPSAGLGALPKRGQPVGADHLLTVKDAATRLACSEAAIRKWIAQGRLRAVRIGRLVRVRPADLERIVEG